MQVYICKFVSKILDILNDGFCVDDAHVHAASEDEDFEIFIIKNANPFSDPNVEEPLPPVTDAVTDPHSNGGKQLGQGKITDTEGEVE